MSAVSSILRSSDGGLMFWCPGCNDAHYVAVSKPLANGARWTFNGDVEKPTFSPSLSIKTGEAVDPNFIREDGDPPAICHSFVINGQIQFCGDSTHALAGQTVDIPPPPEGAF